MIYIVNNSKNYKCTAPDEHRINIFPQGRQWVIDFTICDAITAAELDELLTASTLTFKYYNDTTGEEEKTLHFEGYTVINTASIKYEQDLSCTAPVQLGKEVENNVCEI